MRWPFRGPSARESSEAAAAAAEQSERTQRTGDVLRQARTNRGYTLADVERDTKINRLYIEALEAARWEALPAPVYARGFMRSYARYLGLDADEAARAVPRDLPRPAGLEPSPGLRRASPMILPSFSIGLPLAIGGVVVVAALIAAALLLPQLPGGAPEATPASTPGAGAAVTSDAPNVIGLTREQAAAALQRAGLTPLVFESANAAPAGQVFRQSPPVGFPVKAGEVVTLFVSQGPGIPSPTATPTATASRTPTPTPSATPPR